jgi:hypothetical protein
MMSIRNVVAALVVAGLAFGSAHAEGVSKEDTSALLVPVLKFQAAINHVEPALPAGVFTSDATVVDAFAPYRWIGGNGKSGVAEWYPMLVGATPEEHKAMLAMKYNFTLGKPEFVRIADNDAYLVFAGDFKSVDGKVQHEQKARWIITEKKVDGAWLISSHNWALLSDK